MDQPNNQQYYSQKINEDMSNNQMGIQNKGKKHFGKMKNNNYQQRNQNMNVNQDDKLKMFNDQGEQIEGISNYKGKNKKNHTYWKNNQDNEYEREQNFKKGKKKRYPNQQNQMNQNNTSNDINQNINFEQPQYQKCGYNRDNKNFNNKKQNSMYNQNQIQSGMNMNHVMGGMNYGYNHNQNHIGYQNNNQSLRNNQINYNKNNRIENEEIGDSSEIDNKTDNLSEEINNLNTQSNSFSLENTDLSSNSMQYFTNTNLSSNTTQNPDIYRNSNYQQNRHKNYNNSNIQINNNGLHNSSNKLDGKQNIQFFNQKEQNMCMNPNQNMQQHLYNINEDGMKIQKQKTNKKGGAPSTPTNKSQNGTPNSMVNVNPNIINKNLNLNMIDLPYKQNQKFFSKNINHQQNSLNNKGSLSMQGQKATIPNFNSAYNLSFLVPQRPSPQGQINNIPNIMNPNVNLNMSLGMPMNLGMGMQLGFPQMSQIYSISNNQQSIGPNQQSYSQNKRNQLNYQFQNRGIKDINQMDNITPQDMNNIFKSQMNQELINQGVIEYSKYKPISQNQLQNVILDRTNDLQNQQIFHSSKGQNQININQINMNQSKNKMINQHEKREEDRIYQNKLLNDKKMMNLQQQNIIYGNNHNNLMNQGLQNGYSQNINKNNEIDDLEKNGFPIEIKVKLGPDIYETIKIKSKDEPMTISEKLKGSHINEKFLAIVHRKINYAIQLSKKILSAKISKASLKNILLVRNELLKKQESSSNSTITRSHSVECFGKKFYDQIFEDIKPNNIEIESTEKLNISLR